MKITRYQKNLAVILSLFMIMTVCPLTAFATDGGDVTYVDRTWDSESETMNSDETTLAEPLRSFPGQLAGGGWYYIDEDLTCNDRVTVPAGATVNLILADDVTLTCKNGIYVAATATLNIYGQSEDSGLLKATGSSGNAGIGGNEGGNHGAINIYGGTVDATGGSHAAGIGTGEDADGACGCGEVVERYTETIPATGEPDTPDEPTDPTDPDTPSGDNLCKWDNVDHGTSFRGRIIKFFHSVLYFFAHLFGRR